MLKYLFRLFFKTFWICLVNVGFIMVWAWLFKEIISISFVVFGVSFALLVSHWIYWFSLRAYWVLYWLFSGLIWFSIGFTVGLASLYCSKLQCFLSLAHSGEGGGSSPAMLQTLQSSKKLQHYCFS